MKIGQKVNRKMKKIPALLLLSLCIISVFSISFEYSSGVDDLYIPNNSENDPTYQENLENNTFIWSVGKARGVYASSGFHADDKIRIEVEQINRGSEFGVLEGKVELKSWFNQTWQTTEDNAHDYLLSPKHWGELSAIRAESLEEYWYLHPKMLSEKYGSSRNEFLDINLKEIGYFDIINHSANKIKETLDYEGFVYALYKDVGMRVFNVNDLSNIYQIATYKNASIDQWNSFEATNDDHMMISAGNSGLIILNVQEAYLPFYSSRYLGEGSIMDVAVSNDGDFAYIIDSSEGLVVIDISNKRSPDKLASVSLGENSNYIKLQKRGDYLYCMNKNDGLKIIDVTDENNPSISTTYNSGESYLDISLDDSMLYAITNETFSMLDISNPTNINEYGTYENLNFLNTTSIGSFSANSKNYAIIGLGNGTIQIYDTQNIESTDEISLISSINGGDQIKAFLEIENGNVLVSAYDGGLISLDVSTPTNTQKLDTVIIEKETISGITGQDYINILWKSEDYYGTLFIDKVKSEIYEDMVGYTGNQLLREYSDFKTYSKWFGTNYIDLVEITLQIDEENYEKLVYSRNDGILLSRETSISIKNGTGPNSPLIGNFNIEIYDMGGYTFTPGPIHYVIWVIIGVSMAVIFIMTLSYLINKRQEKLQMMDY